MRIVKHHLPMALTLLLFSCQNPKKSEELTEAQTQERTDGWALEQFVTKRVDNLQFRFPNKGYAYENREHYVKECFDAVESNNKLLGQTEYTGPTKVLFLTSRDEMERETGTRASGLANFWVRKLYLVVTNEDETKDEKIINPPIKHELMHIMAPALWGYPTQSQMWLNEGFATLAANECNGYTVEQIYRFFMEEDLLYPIDSFTTDFFATEEMIGYHQSAYIIQYLIDKYGVEKFQQFWQSELAAFESIYGLSYNTMLEQLHKELVEKYPTAPTIDWEVFKEGCM